MNLRAIQHVKQLMLNRFTFIASVVAFAVLVVEFAAANAREQSVTTSHRQDITEALPHNPEPTPAIFIHRRLMHVAFSKAKKLELRYVECRHYPKQHQKLIQTGLSADGHAVLRMVPGDYCEFASNSPANLTPVRMPQTQPVAPNLPSAISMGEWSHLTEFQRYTCEKFGDVCQLALAVQQAENPGGACEIYHYNSSDGTLDWGYFQINTVHLTRPGLNLKDLLDCKKNIDFAYLLYREKGFAPWVAYLTGAYRRYLPRHPENPLLRADGSPLPLVRALAPM